jgi:hypothetical protein
MEGSTPIASGFIPFARHPTTRVLLALMSFMEHRFANARVPLAELCPFVEQILQANAESGRDTEWIVAPSTVTGNADVDRSVYELIRDSRLLEELTRMVERVAVGRGQPRR